MAVKERELQALSTLYVSHCTPLADLARVADSLGYRLVFDTTGHLVLQKAGGVAAQRCPHCGRATTQTQEAKSGT